MRGIEDFFSKAFSRQAQEFSQLQKAHKNNQIKTDLYGLVVVMSAVDWWKNARTPRFERHFCGLCAVDF